MDLSRALTTPHPFGLLITLLAGPNASVLASTEPGGIDTYKDFAQAYVTYLLPVKNIPTTVDFGKWDAFVGYEGLDSRTQDNDGLRYLSGGLLLHSLTGTYDFALNRNLTLRFELRQDLASKPFFNSASGPIKQRTTFTFAQIIQF